MEKWEKNFNADYTRDVEDQLSLYKAVAGEVLGLCYTTMECVADAMKTYGFDADDLMTELNAGIIDQEHLSEQLVICAGKLAQDALNEVIEKVLGVDDAFELTSGDATEFTLTMTDDGKKAVEAALLKSPDTFYTLKPATLAALGDNMELVPPLKVDEMKALEKKAGRSR